MSATERDGRVVIDVSTTARMLGVDPKTVARWDRLDRLKPAFRTPGGHRRYWLEDIEKLRGQS